MLYALLAKKIKSTSYERVNLGKAKKTANKQHTKGAQIALLCTHIT